MYLFSCMDGMAKESEELRDSKIKMKDIEDKPFMIEGDEFCKFEKMVLDQVALWLNANVQKNEIFTQQADIDAINKPEDKYRSKMFYSIHSTKQALRWMNDAQVEFCSRDLYSDREAGGLTKCYEYDHKHEKWNIMEYFYGEDIDRYWVGVEVACGWNDESKAPIYKRIHPRTIYPDPDGYGNINNFRRFGFSTVMSVEEFKKLDLKNKDEVLARIRGYEDPQRTQAEWQEKTNRWIGMGYIQQKNLVTLYHHYCMWKDTPLLVYMFEDIILDIRCVDELRKCKDKQYKFPIVLYYEDPDSRDPRGTSLWDVIADDQKLETLLMNLFKINIIRNALGWKIFMDRNILDTNLDALKHQTLQNQYFPVDIMDMSRPLSSLIFELPEKEMGWDFYSLLDRARENAKQQTHIDSLTQWVADSKVKTATEASVKQQNANLLQALTDHVLGWGREEKAWLYRVYMSHYFSHKDVKRIRLNKTISSVRDVFKRENILKWQYDIEIVNASEVKLRNQNMLPSLTNWLQICASDPNTPPYTLVLLKRDIAYRQGLSNSEIDAFFAYPPEQEALEERDMLSENIDVEFVDEDADRFCKMQVYQSAKDTPAKQRALSACMRAYQHSMQQQEQQINQINDVDAMAWANKQIVANTWRQQLYQPM